MIIYDIEPTEFYLSQNYPNPFKEKTVIKYCIPYRTKVKLEVFNPEGELIKILQDEEKCTGTYEVEFNAIGLLDGNYIYRFQAGYGASAFVKTKIMSLIH